jgi:hypothetical protein
LCKLQLSDILDTVRETGGTGTYKQYTIELIWHKIKEQKRTYWTLLDDCIMRKIALLSSDTVT